MKTSSLRTLYYLVIGISLLIWGVDLFVNVSQKRRNAMIDAEAVASVAAEVVEGFSMHRDLQSGGCSRLQAHADGFIRQDGKDITFSFVSLHARVPEREASGEARNVFLQMRFDTTHQRKHMVDKQPDGDYLKLMLPSERYVAQCLPCHSTADAAPQKLKEQFGLQRGFGRQKGELASLLVMSVPLKPFYERAEEEVITSALVLFLTFSAALLLLRSVVSRTLLRDVRSVSGMLSEHLKPDYALPHRAVILRDPLIRLSETVKAYLRQTEHEKEAACREVSERVSHAEQEVRLLRISLEEATQESHIISQRLGFLESGVQGAVVPLCFFGYDGTVRYANRAFHEAMPEHMQGYETLAGLPVSRFFREDEAELVQHTVIDRKHREFVTTVESAQRTRKLLWKVASFEDTDQFFAGVLCGFDVTRYEQEKQQTSAVLEGKDLLRKKILHRMKNHMQILLSMIQIRMGHLTDRNEIYALRKTENRVRVIGILYEFMFHAGQDSDSIDMRRYLSEISELLIERYSAGSGGVDLQIMVDDIHFPPEKALSCGMIVNEAVMNALVHGFPQTASGRLFVGLTKADNVYRLVIRDNGIGFGSGVKEGVGATFMRLFASQLGASFDMQGADGGVVLVSWQNGETRG